MKVAFDAGPALGARTGVGRYARELAQALEMQGVELRRYAISLTAPRAEGVRRWRVPAAPVQQLWKRFEKPVPSWLIGEADVVHATNFVLPPTGGRPGVVTIHDLSFLRDDVFPGGERLRDLVPWSLERARVVLVPSEAIKVELCSRYSYPTDRVAVTPEGVSPLFFGATPLSELALGGMGIPGRFVLAVGTIEPRKNLSLLLAAWSAIRRELADWSLVLAGPQGWGPELPATEGVILLGYVAEETLPGLMAAADIFCYPSHYEGFGLPPLEAMATGTPCVAARYSAAEEVLADGAALVDPGDRDQLATALLSLASDEARRRSLALTGRARSTAYTWEKTAAATLPAYEKAASPT